MLLLKYEWYYESKSMINRCSMMELIIAKFLPSPYKSNVCSLNKFGLKTLTFLFIYLFTFFRLFLTSMLSITQLTIVDTLHRLITDKKKGLTETNVQFSFVKILVFSCCFLPGKLKPEFVHLFFNG